MNKYFFFLPVLFFALFSCGNKHTPAATTDHQLTVTTTPTPAADPLDVFVADFKAAVASGDQNKVLALMEFPLKTTDISEKEAFLGIYEYAFDENSKKKIAACTKEDWKMDEMGGLKALCLRVYSEITPEEKKQGMEGSLTAYMIDKIGDKYKIIGIWMAG